MPYQPSTDFMIWPAEPSGGLLPSPYVPPSGPLHWTSMERGAPLLLQLPATSGGFKISWEDKTTDGMFGINALVNVTDDASPKARWTTFCRLIGIYILCRLDEKSLAEAIESLGDIYAWQLSQNAPITYLPQPQRYAVANLREIERTPFTIVED